MSNLEYRIEKKRQIIKLLNSIEGASEELFGLTVFSLNRWLVANRSIVDGDVLKSILVIQNNLQCLAVKSQDVVDNITNEEMTEIEQAIFTIKSLLNES